MTAVKMQPVVCPVLIGREGPLAAVRELLDQAGAGRGGLLLLAGEAGVGKTRLTESARAYAIERGFRVLEGAAFERDTTFPFAPLIDLLRNSFTVAQLEERLGALGSLGASASRLLPELVVREPELARPEPPVPAHDEEAEKRRLFEALTLLLRQASQEVPLFLVIEDLHWSDETTLEWLHAFARKLPNLPILLLVSYRRDETSTPLQRLLVQLDRERIASELVLEPLTRDETAAMLRAIPGIPPPSNDFLESLYRLTDGNPFFIEEVISSSIDGAGLRTDLGGRDRPQFDLPQVPRSVQGPVARRLEQLSPGAVNLATVAAVAGRRFHFVLLRRLTGYDEQETLELLKELIRAQLVVEEAEDRFAFRHALTREAIYATLLARERRGLHAAITESLEELGAPMAEEVRLADLAYHSYRAALWEKALHYADWAGRRARQLYAPRAALEHFGQALEAAGRLGIVPPADLYRQRGLASELLGEVTAARVDLEEALRLSREANDLLAQWQALLDLGRVWAGRDQAFAGSCFHRALELARTLDEPVAVARSLNRVGNWHLNRDQPHEAVAFHQEALAIFRGRRDLRGMAESLDLLGLAHHSSDDQVLGIDCYEQAIGLFRELGDRRSLASCLMNLAELRGLWLYHRTAVPAVVATERARQEMGEALELCHGIGWRSGEAWRSP